MEDKSIIIRPQEGPQEHFLRSKADIILFGGAAGGGKTAALLLSLFRHIDNPEHTAVIFRRTTPQIRNPGGLWDEAVKFYSKIPSTHFRAEPLEIIFPSGSKLKLSHMELERNVYDWQGAAITTICFDELTHFSSNMFFYMLSRNRSLSGIKPTIKATTNPDPDSWVVDFIDWWIGEDGYPIPERSGKIRYFLRIGGDIVWGDDPTALETKYKMPPKTAKSFTFIKSSLADNKILMESNPEYYANLLALDEVESARLLDGNWKVKHKKGDFFKASKFPILHPSELPHDFEKVTVRHWDLAASAGRGDWTVGVKMSRRIINSNKPRYTIEDVKRVRLDAADVEALVKQTAREDGRHCTVGLYQDPGQAGKMQAGYYIRQLDGYSVRITPVTAGKVTLCTPVASQHQAANIAIAKGEWNQSFLNEMEAFSGAKNDTDDQVDAVSGAFHLLQTATSWNPELPITISKQDYQQF
jgi:predicted phage terminase large subunit-like protein